MLARSESSLQDLLAMLHTLNLVSAVVVPRLSGFLLRKPILPSAATLNRLNCSNRLFSSARLHSFDSFLRKSCTPLSRHVLRFPVAARTVTKCSKLGKWKTVKSVAKRFKRTAHGKLKRWRSNTGHLSLGKNRKRRKQLRKGVFVTGSKLKTLNKMLSGR